MLKRVIVSLALLSAGPAGAQSYLVQPNAASCLSRSQAQCTALHCDGTQTKYWWPCQTLTDGTVAVVVEPTGPFGQSVTVNGATAGLTVGEVATLLSQATLGTKLPWVISEAAFAARFTPVQISAINASVDSIVAPSWTAVKAAATTDLTSVGVTTLVNRLVTLGLIPASQVQTILAPIAVAQVGSAIP